VRVVLDTNVLISAALTPGGLEAGVVSAATTQPVAVLKTAIDPDDNRFLECAEAARADFLVTGNLRHYPAECGVTRTVNARQLLLALRL